MAGSTWWPTPANPAKWFSAEQLENSRAYHQPWTRASRAAITLLILLLLALSWLASSADLGRWIYPLTALGVFGITNTYSWWFYARHAPVFDAGGHDLASILSGASWPTLLGLAVSAETLFLLWVFGSGAGLLIVWVVNVGFTWASLRGSWVAKEREPVPPEDRVAFQALADWVGAKCEFVLDDDSLKLDPNARVVRGRHGDLVLVSPGLLGESAELKSLVIGHELCHLKRSHHRRLEALAFAKATIWAATMWAAYSLTDGSLADPKYFPIWLLVSGAAFLGPLLMTNFVARHFERQADADSYELLGSVPTALARQLYARRLSQLDPGVLARALSPHPPAAERLEVVARRIQSL